ncbi:MAG: PIN domain nuclease [Chloroflexi bacterium]|nr:PIN domain nuclease [Chloroflexota bacterium]
MSVELVLRFIGGILAGYGGWELASGVVDLTQSSPQFVYLLLFSIATASFLAAFLLTPYVTTRPFLWVLHKITHTSASDIVAAAIGLIIGLLIGVLLALPLSLLPSFLGRLLPLAASLLLGYFGMTTLITHKREIFGLVGLPRDWGRTRSGAEASHRVLVDTSAIIDGRIADVVQTGFLAGPMVVPRFVLEELQRIADSPDSLRRNRGRRGLDILNKLQKDASVPIEIGDAEVDGNLDVDAKLVRLAREIRCSIVTNDYNLNRVAGIQGVKVLNINELANAVKSVVLPGEEMVVKIIQEGKEYGQGVGYLDDGTMVVVENGRKSLNSNVEIVVTRVLQTVAGRMIFAQPKSSHSTTHSGHGTAA